MSSELSMNAKTKVTIAHLGARKHYQEPVLFYKWGILDTFYTDFYMGNNIINQVLRLPQVYSRSPKFLKKMLDRYNPQLNGAKIIDFPLFGIQYPKRLKNATLEKTYDIFISTGQEFNRKIIAKGLENSNVVYGFNSASLELFQYAKQKGIKCILDQTLAEKSLECQLLLEEEEKWQGWAKSPFYVTESLKRMIEREREEQSLADHIVCGSNFVKTSLVDTGIAPDKITVISLGKHNDFSLKQPTISQNRNEKSPLRILFAGSVGLRKGIPYLLESLKILQDQIPYHCKIAGNIDIQESKIHEYGQFCEFLGRVPRSEMAGLYQWADVFVLPSICEGSAMVTYEAMIYGLPIITTENSGSIVRDGIDGFIVPIRDAQIIAERLVKVFQERSKLTYSQDRENYLKLVNQEAQDKLKNLLMAYT